MECSEAWAALEAEGPIDSAAIERAGRHVERCEACRARLDAETLPPGLLERYRAPPHLARRIGAALDGAARAKSAAVRRPMLQWVAGLAAAFLLGVALTYGFAARVAVPDAASQVMAEAVSARIRASLGDSTMQVASSDQHTVKPWFVGRLDLAPPVRDLAAQGFPLLGGRVDYLAERPVAVLAYRHRQHVVELAVLPAAAASFTVAPRQTADRGYNVLGWRQGDFALVLVSELNSEDLKALQRLLATP